jgi:hypothetical protein
MAVLTSTGITFGNGTILNSRYGIIPQSSIILIRQANAPTGWTKLTTHNDKALRVVSGAGGGSAGSFPFSAVHSPAVSVPGAIGATSLDSTTIASHSHSTIPAIAVSTGSPLGTGGGFGQPFNTNPITTGNAGSGGSHSHPVTAGSFPFAISYVDIILCQFN